MRPGRIDGHGMQRGAAVRINVDGERCEAHEGESVSAALMAAGELGLRETDTGEPRGYFCGMGVCFECVLTIDGVPNTRSCVTWVREGMTVERQVGSGRASDAGGDLTHL